MPHRVAILAYDGLCTFEFGIAVEMFALARPELDGWYHSTVCSLEGRPLKAVGGITVNARTSFRYLLKADTIVIPGWKKPIEMPSSQLIDTLRNAHQRGARLISFCVGSFVLAATGLLDGRSATTHWRFADEMKRRFPAVNVRPDVLYVDEGRVLTAAGSAAGIDLCLHVIRKDFGAAVANNVARRAVVPPHREGGQVQFVHKPIEEALHPWLSHLLAWAQTKLDSRITIEEMARRSNTSKRTLSRRFRLATGLTPLGWLNGLRVRHAQVLLETTALSVEEVAVHCGFGSAPVFRHHFRKRVRLSPSAYRERFHRGCSPHHL